MISVLFAARNSIYKTIPGLDIWDEDRDALNWSGGNPGIFHPPCRLWSAFLSQFSKADRSEKDLGIWSVCEVRKHGGILEQPAFSKLWDAAGVPYPPYQDEFGFSISIDQFWFNHQCRKRTWLYICALPRSLLPAYPIKLVAEYPVALHGRGKVPRSDKRQRSATPVEFARWLIETAGLIR
jgi:hypothetical protein